MKDLIRQLEHRRRELSKAIAQVDSALQALGTGAIEAKPASKRAHKPKRAKRKLSAEGRERIRQAIKRRWDIKRAETVSKPNGAMGHEPIVTEASNETPSNLT